MNLLAVLSSVGVVFCLANTANALWDKDSNLALAWGTGAIWALACLLRDLT